MTAPAPATARLRPLPLLLVLVALQWLMLGNPGYYSHDELQWGAFADVAHWADLPWVGWTDVATFQWRPLTFNSWLLLSKALFEHPVTFHALFVVLGSGLATALAALLWRLGLSPRVAAGAGLVFALNPYAAFVHGWVGTLADLLWVGCALALAHVVLGAKQRGGNGWAVAALAFALTALGLLAKEAALAMPALLGLCWGLQRRERVLGWALLGSGAAAVVYLGLRLETLLASDGAGAYALTPAAVPRNWAAYPLYLLRVSTIEVQGVWFSSGKQLALIALLLGAALLATWRVSPRLALGALLGGSLALAPALPLAYAANQYAYGYSAWLVGCLALAWPALSRPWRGLWLFLAVVVVWHGINVQREMRRVGERQAVFQPALAEALQARPGTLHLLRPERDPWIYARLTHEIPAWRGVPIGTRVAWTDDAAAADFRITDEGGLVPLAGREPASR